MTSTSKDNSMQFHVVSGNDPLIESSDEPYEGPLACSGHKVFITEDFLYLVGGYDNVEGSGLIFKQVWRYNFLLQTWTKLEIPEGFPSHLASFGLCQFDGYSEMIILFGGTDYPFGLTTCSKVHVINISRKMDKVLSVTTLETKGETLENRYGHSFKSVRNPYDSSEVYYSIGGTDGHTYNLDVYSLQKKEDGYYWNKDATTPSTMNGLYKFDVVEFEGKFYFFGGGNVDAVKSLDELYVYDTVSKTYSTIPTLPDPTYFYPNARKCHSVTEYQGNVIIAGGIGMDDPDPNTMVIFDDVWIFNLSNRIWKKLDVRLTLGVFFHDAVVSEEGCLYVFGGVIDLIKNIRTNLCQRMWLRPPSLRTLASSCFAENFRDKKVLRDNNFRMSTLLNDLKKIY